MQSLKDSGRWFGRRATFITNPLNSFYQRRPEMDLKGRTSPKRPSKAACTDSRSAGTSMAAKPEAPVDTTVTTPIPPPTEPVQVDRAAFDTTLHVYGIKTPAKLCHSVRKVFKTDLLNIAKIPNVVKPASAAPGIVLLSRYASSPVPTSAKGVLGNTDESLVGQVAEVGALFSSLIAEQPGKSSEGQQKKQQQQQQEKQVLLDELLSGVAVTECEVQVTYRHCSIEHVLRHLLPAGLQAPSSFETVGHVAHLNLRSEYAQWRYLIGQVMLDKLQPRIRTIVNKVQNTGGPFRIFPMEVLAGSTDLKTRVRENGCTFEMDFSKVYWNSRLETEHRRIVRAVAARSSGRGGAVADAFCGIGPFVLPILKLSHGPEVYANDLNPSSVHFLRANVKLNGMSALVDKSIHVSNSCAREFLTDLIATRRVLVGTVIMNFPAGAPEFLDVFRGLYSGWDTPPTFYPTVHCYCFIKGELETDSARRRVRTAMFGAETDGHDVLSDEEIDVRIVRDVAPKKVQVCITFTVPEQVALLGATRRLSNEPQRKKSKVSEGMCNIT